MKHILNNLISNAIKYSGQQSKIVVESYVDENTLTLNVKDNGIGISPDDQRKLFERFFRASNVNTIRGTGLGLHIVKRYVDAMNGTIDLESEIGKGSIFSIKIPY